MIIEYEGADSAVEKLNAESDDEYYWDGWTICRFRPSPSAIYDVQGVFSETLGWGFVTKYHVNPEGKWNVDH